MPALGYCQRVNFKTSTAVAVNLFCQLVVCPSKSSTARAETKREPLYKLQTPQGAMLMVNIRKSSDWLGVQDVRKLRSAHAFAGVPLPRNVLEPRCGAIIHSPGAITPADDICGAGKSAMDTDAPTAAPTICARIKPGTSVRAIPAKVVVKPRASVTAGFAKDVDDVNQ